jgi:hypothetical protein
VLSESHASTEHDVLSKNDVLSECTCSQNTPSQKRLSDSLQSCVFPYLPELRARPATPLPGADPPPEAQLLEQGDLEPGQPLPSEAPEPILPSEAMPSSEPCVPFPPASIAVTGTSTSPVTDSSQGTVLIAIPTEASTSIEAPGSNPQPPLTLPEIVREAIDVYNSNLPLVQYHVASNNNGQTWSDAAIEWHYRAELKRRKGERKATKVAEEARALRWGELKRRATSAGRYAAELRRRGDQRWRYWNWYSGQLEAEITRRLERSPGLR